MALVGKRWSNKWRSTTAESFESTIIGTRGTENGEFDTDNYRFSQTLELHGPRNQWVAMRNVEDSWRLRRSIAISSSSTSASI